MSDEDSILGSYQSIYEDAERPMCIFLHVARTAMSMRDLPVGEAGEVESLLRAYAARLDTDPKLRERDLRPDSDTTSGFDSIEYLRSLRSND